MSTTTDTQQNEKRLLGALLADLPNTYPLAVELGVCYQAFTTTENALFWDFLTEAYGKNPEACEKWLLDYASAKGWAASYIHMTLCEASKVPIEVISQVMAHYYRSRVGALVDSAQDMLHTGETPDNIITYLQAESMNMHSPEVHNGASVTELVERSMQRHDAAARGEMPGLPSRWGWENQRGNGYIPGTLTLIAARPSVGKTCRLLNQFAYWAYDQEIPCAIASLELTADRMMDRIIADMCSLDLGVFKKGMLSPSNQEKVRRFGQVDAPLYVHDKPMGHSELTAWATSQVKTRGVKALGIDRIELIKAPADRKTDTERITANALYVQALAKTLDVPVICLAQLNREVEKRSTNRPRLADLQQSGALEQCATTVQFISVSDTDENVRVIDFAKDQDGETGHYLQRFNGCNQRYETYDD